MASAKPKQGRLEKRGKWNTKWKARWFKLFAKEKELQYFSGPESSSMKGSVHLDGFRKLNINDKKDYPNECIFVVRSGKRDFFIRASTRSQAKEWEKAIKRSIDPSSVPESPREACERQKREREAIRKKMAEAYRREKEEASNVRSALFGGRKSPKLDGANEHERLQDKCDEHLDNALRMATQATGQGQDTAARLREQREQLERMQDHLDSIQDSTAEGEYHMKNIQSITSAFKQKFKKRPERGAAAKRRLMERSEREEAGGVDAQPRVLQSRAAKFSHESEPTISPRGPRGQMGQTLMKSREEVQDEKLDQISGLIGNMQGIALDIRTELGVQHSLLDEIDAQTDAAMEDLIRGNAKVERLIRKC